MTWLLSTGDEVDLSPAEQCGDLLECHAEPPTCGHRDRSLCDWSHEVSDDEFGYWNEAWGDPPSHVFQCDQPATTLITHPMDPLPVRLCTKHYEEECEREGVRI